MKEGIFVFGDVGLCGVDAWYLPVSALSQADYVRSAGLFLGSNEMELKAAGGIYLGAGYNAMSDAYAEGTGEIFSMCQALGIPCTIYCDEMSWGVGYAGYAAMLGVRKSLVRFVLNVAEWSDVTLLGLEGLVALRDAGFTVGIGFDILSWSKSVCDVVPQKVCEWLQYGVPVYLREHGNLDVALDLKDQFMDTLAGCISCYAQKYEIFVGAPLMGAVSHAADQLGDFSVTVLSASGGAYLWAGVEMSRVEAGDIDSMVQEASAAVSELAVAADRDQKNGLSRRERREAQRQLAKDRKRAQK